MINNAQIAQGRKKRELGEISSYPRFFRVFFPRFFAQLSCVEGTKAKILRSNSRMRMSSGS